MAITDTAADPSLDTVQAQRGYQTKRERVAIAGGKDLVICSLLDRQQFHDPEGDAARLGICSAAWPLFGLLWPSGLQLAEQLAQRPVVHTERILEIGCGLGLASLVGHRRGAHMTASDCHPLAEQFLQKNSRINRLSSLRYRHGQWGAVEDGKPDLADMGRPHERYALIIGSDLLYERDMPASLAFFIDSRAQPSAEVWIVDPNRGNRSAFNREMAAHGFQLARDKRLPGQMRVASGRLESYKGRILVYRR